MDPKKEQTAKPSNKRKITIQGNEYDSLEGAAKAFGKSRNTVDYRLSKGWSPEQAVGLKPPPSFASKTTGIPIQVEGNEFKTIKEATKHYQRAYTHVIESLKKGRSIEQALGLALNENTLQLKNPNLAKQWHPSKNGDLTPNDVSSGSGIKAWWICIENHEWEAVINSRNRGMGCPYCAGQKPTEKRNFALIYPELLKEWDFEKNTHLDPLKLTPRANQKVWWKCKQNHSWQATIQNKTRKGYNGDCPYCINRKLCSENSLAFLRPDIAKDWHPTKNKLLTPKDVIAGGTTKVWWICKHGHEWQGTIGTRVHNSTGCPKCSLQTSRIEIAVYAEIKALFSNVSWREKIETYECDIFLPDKKIGIEIDGVYWHKDKSSTDTLKQKIFEEKGIQLFRLREKGLPLLSERDISFKWSNNYFPIISSLIHQIIQFTDFSNTEREKLQQYLSFPNFWLDRGASYGRPQDAGAKTLLSSVCNTEAFIEADLVKPKIWETQEQYINEGSLLNSKLYREIVSHLPAPPYELSLASKRADLANEWAYDLNAPLSPEHFMPAANKNVWWRCEQGHTWETSLNNRSSQNTGCPSCPRILPNRATNEWNLAKIHPQLAAEWHHEKNGVPPEEITPNSNLKFWWKCRVGHEWQAVCSSRAQGSGCPFCYGRYASETNNLATLYPDILSEWDYELNEGLNPSKLTPHVNKKVAWKCEKGHSWQATIGNRTKRKSGCPICARNNRRKYSIEYFQEFASNHGGKCLSTEYLQGKTKIKMICKKGHKWTARADDIIYEQKWCTLCNKNQPLNNSENSFCICGVRKIILPIG